ncbi:MAG: acylphosphatase [Acidimicrobiia bacterium]
MKTVRAVVSGRVQGVGYRQTCRQTARHLGLVGWVRNLADGRVELLCQGSPEAVDRLIDWAWAGPSAARVTNVESEVVAGDSNLADFLIQPNPAKTEDDQGPR